jgi:hypothetical protein
MKSTLKIIRHRLRRTRARLDHGAMLSEAPILFANAFPKSGTHLLTQVLHGLTQLGPAVNSGLPAVVMYEGETGQPRGPAQIQADLARFHPGDTGFGHLHGTPEILGWLDKTPIAPFFIFRDPRDVVVSHVHYVTEMAPDHVHHAHYRALPDFESRLRTSILGRPELEVPFPDIQARFEPYLGWLKHPKVCVLTFEAFIGDAASVIGEVVDHVQAMGFTLNVARAEALEILGKAIEPKKSPTFRSGKIGGWRASLTGENKTLFKQVAGELLIRLGYESDMDW